MILCIETATAVCSAALCDDEGVKFLRESAEGRSHASQLTLLIKDLLKQASVSATSLSAVSVSKGPGSYTGLRIGVSVAKGIAYGSGIPLIGINTLTAMFHGYLSCNPFLHDEKVLLCPMIDARRMEVYHSLFTPDGTIVKNTSAEIIGEHSFSTELAEGKVIFFGNGAKKCSNIILNDNAVFDPEFNPSASYLLLPSLQAMRDRQFEDVAYFEPFYLKEFIATTPGKFIP